MSNHHPRRDVPALGGGPASADTFLKAGAIGALVGGTGALAAAAPAVRDGTTTREAAAREVLSTAAKTGVATGLGALVARSLSGGPLLSTAAMVLTGAAALYVMNESGPTDTKPVPANRRKAP